MESGVRSLSLAIVLQRGQSLVDQPTAHFFLFLGRNTDIAHYLYNAIAEYNSIDPNHFGNRQRRSDLHRRDSGFF